MSRGKTAKKWPKIRLFFKFAKKNVFLKSVNNVIVQ